MRLLGVACVVVVTLPTLTVAQDVPETPWGAPDLRGNWDFGPSPRSSGPKAWATKRS